MTTIHKQKLYFLDDQVLYVPNGSEFLTAQMQRDQLCVWYRCDPLQPRRGRYVAVVGTGTECTSDWDYLATIQIDGGEFVFHVFIGPWM
jgi:hypothetical protein